MGANTPTKREAGGRHSPASRRAVAYVRVSTVGQAERGMGLQAQTTTVTEYARANGLELLEVVREAASGAVRDGEIYSHEHRPRLAALLDRAERTHDFDVFLVAKLDRLSRDHVTTIFLERTFRRYSVEVVSATEHNGEGAYNAFLRMVTAGVNELERERILERVKAGKAEKKKEGRFTHGAVPYGYRAGPDGRLVVLEQEAAVVRRIFSEARDGRSPARIARELNEAGVRSPAGASWSRQRLHALLANPTYVGELYGVKKAHLAIVSRRLLNQAQAALRTRARTRREPGGGIDFAERWMTSS